jgi:hypothetical protein
MTADRADLWIGLTRLYLRLGKPAEARRYAQMADGFWTKHDPASRWAGESAYWLGQSLVASGSAQASIEPLRRAGRILSSSPSASDQTLLHHLHAGRETAGSLTTNRS